MEVSFKYPRFWGQNLSIILISTGILIGISLFWPGRIQKAEAELAGFSFGNSPENLVILQGNTLLPITNPSNPEPRVIRKINVVITAYSSTSWQTDDSPYITAAGTQVREGIVANNKYPFGTRIRMPELYGDRIFVIEDRMNWEKGKYHIDIWFPSYFEARNFGAKRTYIEILEG